MKKLVNLLLIGAAVILAAGCTPSTVNNQETQFIPEGAIVGTDSQETTWHMPETSKYTIPENAETGENGGPGAMETTAFDFSQYPEDKRPVAAEPGDENTTLIIIYRQGDLGMVQDFDAVDVCDAASLNASLEKNGAFKEGTEVEDFSVDDDGTGHLVLNQLNIYSARDKSVVLAGIANTFIDNLGVKKLEITVGDEDCGEFEFAWDL